MYSRACSRCFLNIRRQCLWTLHVCFNILTRHNCMAKAMGWKQRKFFIQICAFSAYYHARGPPFFLFKPALGPYGFRALCPRSERLRSTHRCFGVEFPGKPFFCSNRSLATILLHLWTKMHSMYARRLKKNTSTRRERSVRRNRDSDGGRICQQTGVELDKTAQSLPNNSPNSSESENDSSGPMSKLNFIRTLFRKVETGRELRTAERACVPCHMLLAY